jgi:hypothetical protein
MEPLYERLLSQRFASNTDAIEFCREACLEYGFTIKQETNPNKVKSWCISDDDDEQKAKYSNSLEHLHLLCSCRTTRYKTRITKKTI